MKLNELAAKRPAKQISKVYESYFGKGIPFENLTRTQTNAMLRKVRGVLGEARQSKDRHFSERNPSYLKLMVMEQALAARLSEMTTTGGVAPTGQQPVATASTGSTGTATVDPKLKMAQDKIKKGLTLNPEEQKLVNSAAAMATESRLLRAYRYLKESEVQQAQVVLAAQDMVDKMQGMLEDVSELQFKELPALVDSIKNQVGLDQANQFNADATAALTGLLQNIQGAKQQLDAALNVVTGQAPAGDAVADLAAAGGDMAAAGADMAAAGAVAPDAGMEPGDDLEMAASAEEPAAGPGLGRARR
jgi:hypothetical protein